MTRKDYEEAARLCQVLNLTVTEEVQAMAADTVVDTFITFFAQDNPRFDPGRFRRACVPGANVKARREI